MRRIRSSLGIWIPALFLVTMTAACFLWPEVHTIPDPVRGNLDEISLPPLSPGHPLGTDQLGNDVLSRALYGGRVSIAVGFGAMSLGLLVGGAIGAVAGYKAGLLDSILMRILDVFLAIPSLVLAIIVATYLGPSEMNVIWAISFFSVPAFARIARANTLRVREQTYIAAARLSGSSDLRILLRHVVPNIVAPLLTFALLGVGIAILVEASLSYLGLGVRPPAPTWGNMIASGQQLMTTSAHPVLIPTAFLFSTVVSLNLLGDALRSRWGIR